MVDIQLYISFVKGLKINIKKSDAFKRDVNEHSTVGFTKKILFARKIAHQYKYTVYV